MAENKTPAQKAEDRIKASQKGQGSYTSPLLSKPFEMGSKGVGLLATGVEWVAGKLKKTDYEATFLRNRQVGLQKFADWCKKWLGDEKNQNGYIMTAADHINKWVQDMIDAVFGKAEQGVRALTNKKPEDIMQVEKRSSNVEPSVKKNENYQSPINGASIDPKSLPRVPKGEAKSQQV